MKGAFLCLAEVLRVRAGYTGGGGVATYFIPCIIATLCYRFRYLPWPTPYLPLPN